MTLFAKNKNNEKNMITVGSRVKTQVGEWHQNHSMYPAATLLTGTVIQAVWKGDVGCIL